MHDNKLLLERYTAGETDEAESRLVEEHCRACEDCAGFLKDMGESRREFLADYPFVRFQRETTPEAKRPRFESLLDTLRRPGLVPAYAVFTALLVAAPLVYYKTIRHTGTEDITFKGGDGISFLLKRKGNVSQCTARDVLYPNDELQVLYSLATPKYMSLLSVDSYGAVSWYQPDTKGTSCSIAAKAGKNIVFPSAILLDDSKGQELVIALFSDAPLLTESVGGWVADAIKKTGGNLPLLRQELEGTSGKIGAGTAMSLFQKGN
jgi:hypothetical protein